MAILTRMMLVINYDKDGNGTYDIVVNDDIDCNIMIQLFIMILMICYDIVFNGDIGGNYNIVGI